MRNQYTNTSFSAKTLKSVLDYREDGALIWKKNGQAAGTKSAYGYVQITVLGELHLAHRLVWLWHTGTWPNRTIDHINGERMDNRIENLRLATMGEQAQNRGVSRKSKTGALGVWFDERRGKFAAEITVSGKRRLIGRFNTLVEAKAAYAEAKRTFHQFHPEMVTRLAPL